MAEKDNNSVSLTINGREISVPKGTTILEAAKQLGIYIPTFCWHPKLKPAGACRICYVEIEKMPKLMVSCATPVAPGMIVHTESEKVKQGRRAVLEFTLINHPLDCPTCDKGGECDLQDLTFRHGVDQSRFDFDKYRFIRDKKSTFDDFRLGPEIIRNQNRCILCYKCVRANTEIFGEDDLGAFQRGNITEIDTPPGRQVDSLYSGNLVEICPVGALTNTDWRYKIRVWNTQTVNSICPYHADGANIKIWKDRQNVFRVTSRRNDAIDEGWLSDVTRYGYQIAKPEGRLLNPLMKKGGSQVAVTWEEALSAIARKFKDIKDNKGGVCIGGMISPQLDCTSVYAFSKFFRTIIHSNNVDFRTEYRMLPEIPEDMYSRMASQEFSIADIEKADLIMVLDSDIMKEHPNVNLRIRKAITQKGARLYTLNPVETKTGALSVDEMVFRVGTLEALLNGVCAGLAEAGSASKKGDTAALKKCLEPHTVKDAAQISGISEERIKAFARAVAHAQRPCLIAGEWLTESSMREKLAGAVHNLALLGSLYEKGQIGLLARAANSKGAKKLGALPHPGPGMIEKMRQTWGEYPDVPGLASDRMIRASVKQELDALFIVGVNPMLTMPVGLFVREGLEKLDFLVVADLYESETTQMADVVLPLSSWAEYGDRFVNLEGRVQEFQDAIKPLGQSRPGYMIVNDLAAQLKSPLFSEKSRFADEVDTFLNENSVMPVPETLVEVRFMEDKINPEFPTPMLVVDQEHHFGHWTEKTKSLSVFCGEAAVEISSALAEKIGVVNGDIIRIESEVGKVNLPARISETIDAEVILVYRNFSASPVNILQMRKRRVDRVKITRVES